VKTDAISIVDNTVKKSEARFSEARRKRTEYEYIRAFRLLAHVLLRAGTACRCFSTFHFPDVASDGQFSCAPDARLKTIITKETPEKMRPAYWHILAYSSDRSRVQG
jgi:hypothetical protein